MTRINKPFARRSGVGPVFDRPEGERIRLGRSQTGPTA